MSSDSISDEGTREQIRKTFTRSGYILDPHGAVAMKALEQYLAKHTKATGIFLETAHPVKFSDVVDPLINQPVAAPPGVEDLKWKKKSIIEMGAAYPELQEFLLKM